MSLNSGTVTDCPAYSFKSVLVVLPAKDKIVESLHKLERGLI